ncbi:MerR family transcriptional regulator [Nonomuraea soli]
MRMAELSAATGVPVPTIKYYVREGLVPAGRPTGRNQADYDDGHVRRLKLVRSLSEYGGLSIAVMRDLMQRLDNPEEHDFDLLGAAQKTITEHREASPGTDRDQAEQELAELVARRGWRWEPHHPATRTAIGILASLHEVGRDDMVEVLDSYAAAAELIAETDIRLLGDDLTDRERAVEIVVIGTAVGDTLIAALRRIAQATLARRTYPAERAGQSR